jgi:(S)-ureidoglycine aminohydrolase
MPELFGHTRARVSSRHALITPANHVGVRIPGFTNASVVALINRAMGAGIAQSLVTFRAGGAAGFPLSDIETFGYFMSGGAKLTIGARSHACRAGHYFFIPPRQAWTLTGAKAGTQIVFFQKKHVSAAGFSAPRAVVGDTRKVASKPHLGDPAVRLQAVLPDEPGFDFGLNILTYQPGAHMTIVETHATEHGLIMLQGRGVCRLEDEWYPVQAGDAIWMAPYCAHWFVAMGKTPAAYLCCENVNRAAL